MAKVKIKGMIETPFGNIQIESEMILDKDENNPKSILYVIHKMLLGHGGDLLGYDFKKGEILD